MRRHAPSTSPPHLALTHTIWPMLPSTSVFWRVMLTASLSAADMRLATSSGSSTCSRAVRGRIRHQSMRHVGRGGGTAAASACAAARTPHAQRASSSCCSCSPPCLPHPVKPRRTLSGGWPVCSYASLSCFFARRNSLSFVCVLQQGGWRSLSRACRMGTSSTCCTSCFARGRVQRQRRLFQGQHSSGAAAGWAGT